ncbi:MAG: carboxymuconolactone decarboxylase family protein [Rhodospirillales bacterium]|nr:carboxymuconolactone decarboxylase family protein [Rhodospirillales bacterium]
MAMISYPDDDNLSADQEVLFDHAKTLMGRLANAVRMGGQSPRLMQPLMGFMVAALRHEVSGILPMEIKSLVILKTSTLNGCAYCIGHNSTLGRGLGFSEEKIAAVAGDYQNTSLFTAPEKAAMAWAECLTEKNYHQGKGKAVKEELKKHFSEPEIIEITMVSGFFNFWNRFTDGLEIDLESEDSVGKIKNSKKVDVDKYVAFMRDAWWNDK